MFRTATNFRYLSLSPTGEFAAKRLTRGGRRSLTSAACEPQGSRQLRQKTEGRVEPRRGGMFIAQAEIIRPSSVRSGMYMSPLTGLAIELERRCYKHVAPPGLTPNCLVLFQHSD